MTESIEVKFSKIKKDWEDIVSLAFENMKDDILFERHKEYILSGNTDGMAFYICNLLEYAMMNKYHIEDTEPIDYVAD